MAECLDPNTGLPPLPENYFWRVAPARRLSEFDYSMFNRPDFKQGNRTHEVLLVKRSIVRDRGWFSIPLPWKIPKETIEARGDILRTVAFPTRKSVRVKGQTINRDIKAKAEADAEKQIAEWGRGVVTSLADQYTFSAHLFAVDNTVDQESILRTAEEVVINWNKGREASRLARLAAEESLRLERLERERLAVFEGDYPPNTLL